MKILCRLGIHKWTKFTEPALLFGGQSFQERKCKHCNVIDRRMVVVRVPSEPRKIDDNYPGDFSGR